VKYWEIIADNLHDAGWNLGGSQPLDSKGANNLDRRWAHGYGKRFVVRADEKLSAFVELESAIRQ
jgi:hypothetical protein